jgi:hypothetical protein
VRFPIDLGRRARPGLCSKAGQKRSANLPYSSFSIARSDSHIAEVAILFGSVGKHFERLRRQRCPARHQSIGGFAAHEWFVIPPSKHATMRVTLMRLGSTLRHHAKPLLAFGGSIGFKLSDSVTIGMNEKRER